MTGPASSPVFEQATSGIAEKSAKTHTELGILYLQSGNLTVALEEARIAAATAPTYAPALNLLGLVHLTLNEIPQARASFERAIQLAPGDPQIANDYGWFLCQSGREQEAFNYFEASARNPLYKTPTRPYTNAGLCYLKIKDEKAAEANFQRAAHGGWFQCTSDLSPVQSGIPAWGLPQCQEVSHASFIA